MFEFVIIARLKHLKYDTDEQNFSFSLFSPALLDEDDSIFLIFVTHKK